MTSDGSTLKIYINGSLESSTPAGQAFTGYTTPEFILGQPQETPNYFNGQIYDVRLIDHVLSDSEIAALGGSGTVTFTLTATAGTGGTINPSGPVLVNQGTNKTFSINPNNGFEIANVSIDNNPIGTQSAYTFNNVNANHIISATFSSIPVTNLTIAGVLANSKVYNRTTSATLNTGGAILVGVLGSDNVILITSSATGTFINKNVGTGIIVTTSGFTLSGSDAVKYSVTQPTATANITAASLTISGVIANNKVYDLTTTATLNTVSATLSGVFGGDVVNLSLSGVAGTFANKNAGSGKPVTTSGFSLGGSNAGNYILIQPTTTANITTSGLTLIGVTANNKVYNGTTAATLNSGSASLVGILGADVVNLVSTGVTGTFANKNAGTGIQVSTSGFTLGGSDGGNYSFTQPSLTANITAASLTVSGLTANNKVYDGTTTATLNFGSASLSGVFGGDNVILITSGATGTFADSNVGTAKPVSISGLTLGGKTASDYSLIQPSSIANITGVILTVTGILAHNKVYDATTLTTINTESATLVGTIGTDNVTFNSTGATGSFANRNVGSGKIVTISGLTLSGPDAGRYSLIQPTTTANITPAGTIISGVTVNTRVYNGTTSATLNAGSGILAGIFGGDAVNIISSGASGTFSDKDTGLGKPVATSGFILGGANAGNYTLTQPSLSATITPATLTLSGVTAINKVYDGTTTTGLNAGGCSLVGVYGTDDVILISSAATGNFANKNVGTTIPVSGSGFLLGGTDGANYTLTQPSVLGNISPKALTITADNLTKPFRTTLAFTGTEYAEQGLVNGDALSGIIITCPGALASADVGTYVISIEGGVNSNYQISYSNGALTVSKSTIVATADNKTKVYGSDNPVLSISYSGFINNENESSLDVLPVAETNANKNSESGDYEIDVSGAASKNYSFAYNKGVLTINKADQVISFAKISARLRMTEVKPLIATAAIGLTVSFESSDPSIASVNNDELSINSNGNVKITAIQEGDHNWNPANNVSQSIVTLPAFDNIMSLFTPNNDGVNDYWYVPDIGQFGTLQVTVYNRFGQIVYQSDSYKNDWDGTRDGYPLPAATYYYLIKSSEKGFIKGVVNIIR